MATSDWAEEMSQEELAALEIRDLLESAEEFDGELVCNLQNDLPENPLSTLFTQELSLSQVEVEPSSKQFVSSVLSRNRAVDAFYKAPIVTLKGYPPMGEPGTYSRCTEMIGDMRPNLFWQEEGESPQMWKISTITSIDVSCKLHYLLTPSAAIPKSNFTRFNLFNGQILVVENEAGCSWERSPFWFFENIRGMELGAAGYRAGITREEALPHVTQLESPAREYELVSAALNSCAARGLSEIPNLVFYRMPYEWLHDSECPENVRDFLERLTESPSTLPQIADLDPGAYIHTLQEILVSRLESMPPEMAKLAESVIDQLEGLDNVESASLLKDIRQAEIQLKRPKGVMLNLSATQLRPTVSLGKLSPEFHSDPAIEMTDALHHVNFAFAGVNYTAPFQELGFVNPTVNPNLKLDVQGSSQRLASLLGIMTESTQIGNSVALLVKFTVTLRTHWQSVVTRRQRSVHGFGSNGSIWNEFCVIHLNYSGLWFLTKIAEFSEWTTRCNNQLVAEFINGGLLTSEIHFATDRSLHQISSVPKGGRYLDGPDWLTERTLPGAYPFKLKETSWHLSGITPLIPPSLLDLVLREPDRCRLSNLDDFLEGRNFLYFQLKSEGVNDAWSTFAYQAGLDTSVAPHKGAGDWFKAMLDGKKSPDKSPAVEAETTVPLGTGFGINRRGGRNLANRARGRGGRRHAPGGFQLTIPGGTPSASPEIQEIANNVGGSLNVPPSVPTDTAFMRGQGSVQTTPKSAYAVPKGLAASSGPLAPPKGVAALKEQVVNLTTPALAVLPNLGESQADSRFSSGQPYVPRRDAEGFELPVPAKPIPSAPHFQGNWLSEEILQLRPDSRRYVASRCQDILQNRDSCGFKDHICPIWAETLRKYIYFSQLPSANRQLRPGSGRFWWVPVDPRQSIPVEFRTEIDGTVLPDIPDTVPKPERLPMIRHGKDLPNWKKPYGLQNKAPLFN